MMPKLFSIALSLLATLLVVIPSAGQTSDTPAEGACPMEQPEEGMQCSTSDANTCTYMPEAEGLECYESFSRSDCTCMSGMWSCSNITDYYVDSSCGPPEEFLCPEEPPRGFASCDFGDIFVNCTYDTAKYCCPETGECSIDWVVCFGTFWLGLVDVLGEECPSIQANCPAESPELGADFAQTCIDSGVPIPYDCNYFSDECCPESGECAIANKCSCYGGDSGGNCQGTESIFCPSQVCPEEAPVNGTSCEVPVSDFFLVGSCRYYQGEPECFEEVAVEDCECISGSWFCFDYEQIYFGVFEGDCPSGEDDDDDDEEDGGGKKGGGKKGGMSRTLRRR